MSNSAKNIIIASDFGGTKGDLFIVNADDGSILRHVFKTWRDLPKEILSEIKTTKGGIGRSPQMFCYCLEKAMPGLDFDNYYFVSSGFCFYTTLTEFLGSEPKLKLVMGEANGVMFAEGFKTGICSLLGTGATSDIFIDGQSTFLIDSFGPVCGDWGGADYIGFNFLRNVMREQMFLDEMMPETNAILQFIDENVKDAHPYDHSKPITPIRANSRIVTVIACHENNVSLVSSFAAVCDSCARNGSAIAQNVLETAGREIAENIYRSAVFKKIDKIDGLPIVVSGSVFMHSDIVFESFRKTLSPKLPNAKIIRSFKPQAYGQVIRMLQEIHTPEKAAECIARFKQDIENLINVTACNSNSNKKIISLKTMNTRRYLIIGAHPDDSDLRFGGTAIKLAQAGHQVKFVSLTNGSCGHYSMGGRALAERRYKEAQDSKKYNMVCEYEVWDIDDCQITPSLENRERLIRTIRKFAPDVVISHRLCDYHADHRNTAQLVLDSAYLVKVPLYVPDTPIPETEPVFGYFFDEFQDPRPCRKDAVVPIDDVMEQKCKGIDCHVSQFYEWLPKDRLYTAPPHDSTPWEERYKHLLEYWSKKYIDCANDARAALKEFFGEAGSKVKYAEAFEFSPYGRRVSRQEFQQLFMP